MPPPASRNPSYLVALGRRRYIEPFVQCFQHRRAAEGNAFSNKFNEAIKAGYADTAIQRKWHSDEEADWLPLVRSGFRASDRR